MGIVVGVGETQIAVQNSGAGKGGSETQPAWIVPPLQKLGFVVAHVLLFAAQVASQSAWQLL